MTTIYRFGLRRRVRIEVRPRSDGRWIGELRTRWTGRLLDITDDCYDSRLATETAAYALARINGWTVIP